MKKIMMTIGSTALFIIFGVIGTALGNQIFYSCQNANKHKAWINRSNMSTLKLFYATYKSTYETPPQSWDNLIHTPDNLPLIDGVDITEDMFVDPWGKQYRLLNKNGAVFIISNGPDERPDTDDDVIDQIKF